MAARKKAIILVLGVAAIAVVGVGALFAYRPALVIGVRGHLLGSSIRGVLGREHFSAGSCREVAEGHWECSMLFEPDPGSGGGPVRYMATTDSLGCWKAKTSFRGSLVAARPSGCIEVPDLFY